MNFKLKESDNSPELIRLLIEEFTQNDIALSVISGPKESYDFVIC